jgi:hypothetical protein
MIAGKYYLLIGPCCTKLLSYSFPSGNIIYTSTQPAYENFKSLFITVVFLHTDALVKLVLCGSSNRPFCLMRILWRVSCKNVNNVVSSRRFMYKILWCGLGGLLKEFFFHKSRDIEIFHCNKWNCKTFCCKRIVIYGLDMTSECWHQRIESQVVRHKC